MMKSAAFLLVLVIVCTGCNCEISSSASGNVSVSASASASASASVDISAVLKAFLGFQSSIVDSFKGVVSICFDFWKSWFQNVDFCIGSLLNIDLFKPVFSILADFRELIGSISITITEIANFFLNAFDELKHAITQVIIPSYPMTELKNIGDLYFVIVEIFKAFITTSISIWETFWEKLPPPPNVPEIIVNYYKALFQIFFKASSDNFINFLSTVTDAYSLVIHFISRIDDILVQLLSKLPFPILSNIRNAIQFVFGILEQIKYWYINIVDKIFWKLPVPAALADLAEYYLKVMLDFRSLLVSVVDFIDGLFDTYFASLKSLFLSLKYAIKSLLEYGFLSNPIYTIIIDFIEDVSTSIYQIDVTFSDVFEHWEYIILHLTIPSFELTPIRTIGDLWYGIVQTFIRISAALTNISVEFWESFPTAPKIIEIFINYYQSIFAIFNKTSLKIVINFLTSVDDGRYLVSRFISQIAGFLENLPIPKLPFLPYYSLDDVFNWIIELVELAEKNFWSLPIPDIFLKIATKCIEFIGNVHDSILDALPGLLGGDAFYLSNDIGKLISSITSKLFPNLGIPVISIGTTDSYPATTATVPPTSWVPWTKPTPVTYPTRSIWPIFPNFTMPTFPKPWYQ
ncbi:uncharacterized protein LOC126882879 isoform X2 [Diabrotica virgifera virgifera]|uniref:Uncharacterized protein n=1 Tax=Diabrotica virgifera virgifera TaxID=50390 RepID=A0ABM5K128_DIAVI|nr:uncharacterized protein LOC126882879 isoform X2 [Diabrotica virgifera virgifera]